MESDMDDPPVQFLFGMVLGLYSYVVITNAVLSWLVAFDVVNLRNRLVATVDDTCRRLTDPALAPIRKVIPNLGGVDLSPVALIIGIFMLQKYVVPLIPF
jgi:YggT family protein